MKHLKHITLMIADEFLAVYTIIAAMVSGKKYTDEELEIAG